MNDFEIERRIAVARRNGNWAEVKRLTDLRHSNAAARRQQQRQAAGATVAGGFHENHHGFNSSANTRAR